MKKSKQRVLIELYNCNVLTRNNNHTYIRISILNTIFSIIGFQSLADNLNISSLITINWYSNNMFYNIGYIALFFIVTYLIFIFLELL